MGPGVNGGFQGTVKSPMNKGRAYRIPGIGLAGDWPGGWTQTYAQVDTEAGRARLRQGLLRAAGGRFVSARGRIHARQTAVIDLGWGTLKSALVNLQDSGFVTPHEARAHRQTLVNQYVAAFRHVEAAALDEARSTLNDLAAKISAWVVTDQQAALESVGGRPTRQVGVGTMIEKSS